jgi:hypothetical protein
MSRRCPWSTGLRYGESALVVKLLPDGFARQLAEGGSNVPKPLRSWWLAEGAILTTVGHRVSGIGGRLA